MKVKQLLSLGMVAMVMLCALSACKDHSMLTSGPTDPSWRPSSTSHARDHSYPPGHAMHPDAQDGQDPSHPLPGYS